LPRFAYSKPIDVDELQVVRRIVPAFRNPPGPQLLGRTTDYTGRLLELTSEQASQEESMLLSSLALTEKAETVDSIASAQDTQPRRLLETLREMDLLVDRRRDDDPEPFDITRTPARPPASRSARLSSMARAETGALVNQWYRNILGPDGYVHEVTLGEVRHGYLALAIEHPLTGNTISIGMVRVTEVEAIEDLNGIDEQRDRFDIGYGLCLGHNEKKAIAMANLDIACHRDNGRSQLEQSLLLTTDGLDSSGFLEHLKLPHYVTFRSMVERKLAVRKSRTSERDT
jgi:alpha-D-ribose 1-methylphosphonate 5-triphosphate synthase subunit PhnI